MEETDQALPCCPECGPTSEILHFIRTVVDPELARLRAERNYLLMQLERRT